MDKEIPKMDGRFVIPHLKKLYDKAKVVLNKNYER